LNSAANAGDDLGNGITLPGESANQRGGGAAGGGGFGAGAGGGGQLGGGGQGGQLGGGLGQGGGANLQGGQGLVPDSITFISFDPTDNSLIVQGTNEDDITALQNLIAQFDVRPKQVSVKVEFITTTENLDQSLGFGIQYSRGTLVAGLAQNEFLRASDPVFLTYATGDAVIRLRTRLATGYGRVVTAPILRTLNNTPATVAAITNDWILTTTSFVTNGIVQAQVNPIPLQIGTVLTLQPRINGDGTITMGMTPQVSNVTGLRPVTLGQGQSLELPIFVTQAVSVIVNVRDGETIVLGGLNSESQNSTINRVPVLSDLPIIGQFFKRVIKQKSSSELLIFVTPKIINDDDGFTNP
jgi:type II secretory pathway component GspD/PulD (secretin)